MRLIDADALYIPPEEMNARMAVHYAPTIDAETVKHGEWEYIGGYGYKYRCSECVMCAERKTNYCSYCGAKMDGGKDDG